MLRVLPLVGGALASLAVAQTPAVAAVPIAEERYVCCNLQQVDGWIGDHQFVAEPVMIPLGTRVRILEYGHRRAYLQIDGKKVGAGADGSHDAVARERLAELWLVPSDPNVRLAPFDEPVRQAFRARRLMPE